MSSPIVFLDIDGVLNGHEFNRFTESTIISQRCVAVFNTLTQLIDPDVVLSSAWRYMISGGAMTIKGFNYMLRTHGVIARIVDVTVPDEVVSGRQEQIAHWYINNGKSAPYVVLDDMSLDPILNPFVKTDPATGIIETDVKKAVALINKQCSSRNWPLFGASC